MKKRIIPFLLFAFALTLGSCVKDDIENLQGQINDLNGKIEDLEKAQKEALENQIAELQAVIQTMEAELSADIAAGNAAQDEETLEAIADLLAQLEAIQNEVNSNAASIHYGNLITDEDYAAFEASGADVVTGKVIVSTQAHADLLNGVRWIGLDLESAIGTLTGIQSVGGNVTIVNDEEDAVINLVGLKTIGGSLLINNLLAASVTADDLVIHTGDFNMGVDYRSLTTISMSGLELIGDIYVDNFDDQYYASNLLRTLDINGTSVARNAHFNFITATELIVGNVGGNLEIRDCNIDLISLVGTEIGGNLIFEKNAESTEFSSTSLTKIGGDISVTDTYVQGAFDPTCGCMLPGAAIETFSLSALTHIEGDVNLTNNPSLVALLNSVTDVNGNIYVEFGDDNDPSKNYLYFEGLVNVQDISLKQYGGATKFTGFNNVVTVKNIELPRASYTAQFEIFNSLVTTIGHYSLGGNIYIETYYNSDMDISPSFQALTDAKSISLVDPNGNINYVGDIFPALKNSNLTLESKSMTFTSGFSELISGDLTLKGGIEDISMLFGHVDHVPSKILVTEAYEGTFGPATASITSLAGLAGVTGDAEKTTLDISFANSAVFDLSGFLPDVEVLQNLYFKNIGSQVLDGDFTNYFTNLKTIAYVWGSSFGQIQLTGEWSSIIMPYVTHVNEVRPVPSTVTSVVFASLEKVGKSFTATQIGANGITIDVPVLDSIGDFKVECKQSTADVLVNAPLLQTCNYMHLSTYGGTVNSFDAQFPSLTSVTKLLLNMYDQVMDESKLLTSLTSITGTDVYRGLYLGYVSGQTLCNNANLQSAIANWDYSIYSASTYIYKDKAYQNTDALKQAAIDELTTCP